MTTLSFRFAVLLLAATAVQSWGQNFKSVYSFPADGANGTKPLAALTIGPDGNLYGTASEGGVGNAGTAFKFNPVTKALTQLGSFAVADTGKVPVARLINIGDGFLYGATSLGTGTAGDPIGTVFKLDPAGGEAPAGGLTKIFALPGSGTTPKLPFALVSGEANVLHVLGSSPGGIWRVPLNGDPATDVFTLPTSGDDGIFPRSLIRGTDGNFYGVTQGTAFVGTMPGRRGTVFTVAPNGTGFSKLHDCLFETGVAPLGAMVQGPDGTFYGTMSAGGTDSDGVIFKITPAGEYTVLHNVADNSPSGDLLLASDGRLYGISRSQGTRLFGSVFRINTNGTGFQVLMNFDNTNGANPEGGLVQAADGNIYGVTSSGGINGKGTIFQIDLNLPTPEVNRRPIAIDDQEFSAGSAVVVNVLANDFDPDEDALTVTVQTQPLNGTVNLESNGAITYSPTPGSYMGFDQFTYRITDPDGLFDEATVTIADDAVPEPWQPGTYNGILNLDPALTLEGDTPRGQLVITITESGLLTGKLFTNGKRLSVRGAFDPESGAAIAVVKESKKKKAVMFLAKGEGNSLIAVMFGTEQLSGVIFPLVVPDPAAVGSFTTLLESTSPGLPAGYGFGAMRILSNGVVVVVGKLGDGSKLAWGTTLVSFNGDIGIPVFSMPVKGGFVAGSFVESGNSTLQGTLKWFRPEASKPSQPYAAGFSGECAGLMDRYTRPPKGELVVNFGQDQAITIVCPALGPEASGTATTQGTRLRLDGALKSLSFSKATGLFKGKVKAGNKTVTFQGAVTQSGQAGYGYYVLDKVSGAMGFESDIE